MNLEFEIKNIIRNGGTHEQRAESICNLTVFSRENVMSALNKGGETIAEVYGNIVREHRNPKSVTTL